MSLLIGQSATKVRFLGVSTYWTISNKIQFIWCLNLVDNQQQKYSPFGVFTYCTISINNAAPFGVSTYTATVV